MPRNFRHCVGVLLTAAAFWLFITYKDVMSEIRTRGPRYRMRQIQSVCEDYAKTHGNTYPDGESSNETFRKLFSDPKMGGDVESTFLVSPPFKKHADGEIGDASDGYSKALEPGECDVYYVRPQPSATNHPKTPRVFALVRTSWINYWVWSSYGTMTKDTQSVGPLSLGFLNAEEVDLLSPDYWKQFGVDFKDVLAPEGYTLDVPALNRENQANRRASCLILVPYGLFVIGDIVYFCYKRRKLKKV